MTAGPLVQVSGTSTFTGCTADNVAGQSGTVFLHSLVGPWIGVNPTNGNNIVGIWQQDRRWNGGAWALVAGVSFQRRLQPDPVRDPGNLRVLWGCSYDRSADPWVAFGPAGVVDQLALSFNAIAPPFTARDFDHALLASKSEDGGLTWSRGSGGSRSNVV
jgi:hypothetical protein